MLADGDRRVDDAGAPEDVQRAQEEARAHLAKQAVEKEQCEDAEGDMERGKRVAGGVDRLEEGQ